MKSRQLRWSKFLVELDVGMPLNEAVNRCNCIHHSKTLKLSVWSGRQLKIIRNQWGKVNTWPNEMFPSQKRRCSSFIKCWFGLVWWKFGKGISPFRRSVIFPLKKANAVDIVRGTINLRYSAHFPSEAVELCESTSQFTNLHVVDCVNIYQLKQSGHTGCKLFAFFLFAIRKSSNSSNSVTKITLN